MSDIPVLKPIDNWAQKLSLPTDETFKVEAVKYSYRQTKDGHVVSFVIHPSDINLDLTNAPIGQRFELVLRQLDEHE